ncbi:MAG: mannitol dehydrogenase, partial [Oscillospiraceae bacterium]|nr:mannitol dehydrogenase [Oscillospiraceae bacterium]
MKKAVMYGGGNIGRGFIGALLSQSGYEVTFIDVAEAVVTALQEKNTYPVRYVTSDGYEDVWVKNVTAVNGNDTEAASDAIANCDIMATAVGARILKFIVPNIVAGLRKRWAKTDAPLNIIICENLMDANKVLEGMLKEQLTVEECALFDKTVGLVEASIGRMVPVQTEAMKDGEPLRVCVERYGFLPVDKAAFRGEIPAITNMVPCEPFDFYIKRKLYVHNMGHATCAYLGDLLGLEYIYQAIAVPEIRILVHNAMLESAAALAKMYDKPLQDLL